MKQVIVAVIVAVVVLGVATALFDALSEPSRVDDLTIENPTDFALQVRVGSGDGSWLGVGTVAPGNEHTFGGVIDQGDTWVFEFRFGGEVVGDQEVTRSELADSDWRISVPEEVGEQLEERGEEPTPG